MFLYNHVSATPRSLVTQHILFLLLSLSLLLLLLILLLLNILLLNIIIVKEKLWKDNGLNGISTHDSLDVRVALLKTEP